MLSEKKNKKWTPNVFLTPCWGASNTLQDYKTCCKHILVSVFYLVKKNMCTNSVSKNSGNLWTALAHIITGVIGSGVLSLAWSMSRLGWVAGPVTMLLFATVTFISASLLCNCYKSPDPERGPTRNRSYLDAVQMILGKKSALFVMMELKIFQVFLYA